VVSFDQVGVEDVFDCLKEVVTGETSPTAISNGLKDVLVTAVSNCLKDVFDCLTVTASSRQSR